MNVIPTENHVPKRKPEPLKTYNKCVMKYVKPILDKKKLEDPAMFNKFFIVGFNSHDTGTKTVIIYDSVEHVFYEKSTQSLIDWK